MTHSKWHLEVIREDIKEGKGTGKGREGQWEAMMHREGTFITIKKKNIIKNKREEKSAGADATLDVDDTHDIDAL